MPQRRNPEIRDLLGEALHAHDQEAARQAAQRYQELGPRSSDPVLDKLFTDFAARMRKSSAVPFIVSKTVSLPVEPEGSIIKRVIKRNVAGWQLGQEWNGGRSVSRQGIKSRYERNRRPTRRVHEQVAEGWAIRDERISYYARTHSDRHEHADWFGLAVDTDGNPWFGSDTTRNEGDNRLASDASRVVVGGVPIDAMPHSGVNKEQLLGKHTRGDLHLAIVNWCGIADVGREKISELIAQTMAATIRGE